MNENIKKSSRRWKFYRRLLISLACAATLVAAGYILEDIHGKRAWEARKSELEAQGLKMDWAVYIPSPIPDAQNFYKAPGIAETDWVGRGARGLGARLNRMYTNVMVQTPERVRLANLVIVPPDSATNGIGVKLDSLDKGSHAIVEKAIREEWGPSLKLSGSLDAVVFARPEKEIKPVKFWAFGTNGPSWNTIWSALPVALPETNKITNNLIVPLDVSMIAAQDFLEATKDFDPDLAAIREALKRPYAYMAGDYTLPYAMPIPNFVLHRRLAQLLANRAKCHLLLGQPDQALDDLTLMKDVCRILESQPADGPITLVAAMINVAIHGLYIETIEDGFRLHAWQPAQLVALQQQCENTQLTPFVADAFRMEIVATTYTTEHSTANQLIGILNPGEAKTHFLKRFENPVFRFFFFAPRGLIYENMIRHTKLALLSDGYDFTTGHIAPERFNKASEALAVAINVWSPLNFLVSQFLPNSQRAWQKAACVQTFVNETAIACALERFRLEHGQYPETLDALTPEFMQKVPSDIVGGQPLKYRRQNDGTFLLYSIGWNEKDDGGRMIRKGDDVKWDEGDWVWSTAE